MLVYGGASLHHDESVRSARNTYAALDGEKYWTALVYIDPHGKWWLLDKWVDALDEHGGAQVLLAPAMHSIVTIPGNRIIHADVIVPLVRDSVASAALSLLDIPCIGSSLETQMVTSDPVLLQSKLAQGDAPEGLNRKLLVALLGRGSQTRASGVGEIVTDDSGPNTLLTNIELTPSFHELVLQRARAAYQTLDVHSLGLVTLFTNGKQVIIESVDVSIDFASTDPWVALWRASGMHYPELIDRLIAGAARSTYTKNK